MGRQRWKFNDFSMEELNNIESRGRAFATGIQGPVARGTTAAELDAYDNLACAAQALRQIKMSNDAQFSDARWLRPFP